MQFVSFSWWRAGSEAGIVIFVADYLPWMYVRGILSNYPELHAD
jgi:ABC-type sulfate transport system permease component